MPKRTLLPKRPGRARKSKELQSTLLPSVVGPVSNSSETQELSPSIIERSIDPILESLVTNPQIDVSIEYLSLYLRDLHKTTLDTVSNHIAYYQVEEGIPPHTVAKIDAILAARNIEEAKELSRKANQSGFMYCLSMWAKGKAKGPRTKEYIEHEAKKAAALATRLEAKGYREAAAKHRMQALALWDELDKIREYHDG